MTQTTFDYEAGQQAIPKVGTLNAWVLELLFAGYWHTPKGLIDAIKFRHGVLISDSSCTARLRDLRKPQYGAHVIEKRRREGSRAYEYRLAN